MGDRQQFLLRPVHVPPEAPDDVSMSWNAGQTLSMRVTTPSPAVTRSVPAVFLISVTASFKRWQARCDSTRMPEHETGA